MDEKLIKSLLSLIIMVLCTLFISSWGYKEMPAILFIIGIIICIIVIGILVYKLVKYINEFLKKSK